MTKKEVLNLCADNHYIVRYSGHDRRFTISKFGDLQPKISVDELKEILNGNKVNFYISN